MAKFKVIEGTIWEIEAETVEQAKATYEAYFKGDEVASDLMNEVEGSSYWYGTEYQEGAQYVLEYLSDLYEGLNETDIWADYMEVEGKK